MHKIITHYPNNSSA